MNLDTETWDVINSYFRDIPNTLVRHHIDSYNDFIINKIPQIFKNFENNPQTNIVLLDANDIHSGITYEIKVYYGGKNHDKYKFGKPTIVNFPSGDISQLYPNEARLKKLTYGADFFYSVEVECTMKKNGVIIFENEPVPNPGYLDNIHLGKIPVMLKSCLCILNDASSEMLVQMGEDPYDLGGYLILDGSEKTIVSQERKAENIIFLNTVTQSTGTEKYTHFVDVKCVSDEAFSKARTVKVQFEKDGPITVRLGQLRPLLKENNNRDVPLFIMFRALGVETDKEIIQYIIGDELYNNINSEKQKNNDLTLQMLDLLRPSILDPYIIDEKIYDRELAEAYLVVLPSRADNSNSGKGGDGKGGKDGDSKGGKDGDGKGGKGGKGGNVDGKSGKDNYSEISSNKVTQLSYLYSTLNESLFPHINNTSNNVNKSKAYYLGYLTRKLLLLKLGLIKDTDRDNFINKRIDLSGFLMASLFRDAFDEVIRNVRVSIGTKYTFNYKEYSGDNIVNIINETTYKKFFSIDKFKEHFNSQLKVGNIGEKKGVVQLLDRGTRHYTIAHLRRIIDNISGGQRVTNNRRRLHATQYGCVCPAETPEGQKVGLNKGLAIISHITFGCNTKPIREFCISQGLETLDDFLPAEIHNLCKVFINGNWFGCHRNPEAFIEIFRLYRRNGLINIFTSIAWECSENEIKIYTDGGRFVRPLYIIENNNLLIQPHHIKDINTKTISFTDLVSGFRKRKHEYNYYDDDVKSLSSIYIDSNETTGSGSGSGSASASGNTQHSIIIDKLRESQSVIEYIDSQEFDTTLLSSSFNILHNNLQHYTHIELHPSMFLSFNAHLLPFIQYNAGTRVIYGSKMVKQGISTYSMNFNNRIDTSAMVLNYPEKPMITCRLNNALGGDKFGHGQNIFVAVAKYNYNQDDAIVGNQSSIDMGLFGISYYKMYEDHEETNTKTGDEFHFYNPDLQFKDEMPNYPEKLLGGKLKNNYSKMDKYGLPIKGEFIENDDIVIGKYFKTKDDSGNVEYRDMSTPSKTDMNGSFVDRVFTWQTNQNGDRMVKVRTCQHKPPVMGDKFSSRNCQKGTFGIVLKKEDLPYTEDGIVPDMILDPASYPSRMTMSQFIEILFGNMAPELGLFGSYNAFETVNLEQINDILETKLGMTSMGNRFLYNGMSGQQMEVTMFSGIVYYQRLKYLVDDKINIRESGHRDNQGITMPGGFYTVKERQSVAGRANHGGLRIGEMERDALLSHGIWGFIKETYIERCDKFIIQVSKASGEISICNPESYLFYDNQTDGIVSYQIDDKLGKTSKVNKGNKTGLIAENIIGLNTYGHKQLDYVQLVVPYTFKLLLQEMQGMCMSVKMDVNYLNKLNDNNNNNNNTEGGIIELTEEDIDNMLNYNGDLDGDGDGDGDGVEVDDGEDNYNEQNGGGEDDDDDEDDEDEDAEDNEDDEVAEDNGSNGTNDENNNENHELINQNGGNALNQPFQRANLNADIMPGGMMNGMMNPMQGGMQVHMDKGNDDDTQHIDLSAYGGSKPEFDIKERDDYQVIEDMNSKLLGLQTGGARDKLENAKSQGINNILQSQPIQMQNDIMQTGGMKTMNNQGLNMSYGQQQPMMNQPMMNQQQPMMNQQNGGMPRVSFDSNIKVVELDTKVSDGFFYSGSKNLDPFAK